MLLNRAEKALMNNPVREAIQWRYEAPLLKKLGGTTEGLTVLEIGCGRGVGTEIIFDVFGAAKVHAFDLDPDMVEKARTRLSRFSNDRLILSQGDASHIEAEDASFDAVFDFGIIHHVPHWKKAVSEVVRVLKPGGRFFFEEVTQHALNRWFYRTFLKHPEHDRFSGQGFIKEIENQGLEVGANWVEKFFGDFVIGVGSKPIASNTKIRGASS